MHLATGADSSFTVPKAGWCCEFFCFFFVHIKRSDEKWMVHSCRWPWITGRNIFKFSLQRSLSKCRRRGWVSEQAPRRNLQGWCRVCRAPSNRSASGFRSRETSFGLSKFFFSFFFPPNIKERFSPLLLTSGLLSRSHQSAEGGAVKQMPGLIAFSEEKRPIIWNVGQRFSKWMEIIRRWLDFHFDTGCSKRVKNQNENGWRDVFRGSCVWNRC